MGLIDAIVKNGENRVSLGFENGKMDERLAQIPFIFRHIRPTPAKILEIGCCDSLISIQLAALRYNTVGIDYRDYNYKHNNLKFIRDDFNTHDFGKEKFDVIIVMNAIEHFGLQYYKKDEPRDQQADVKAMTKIKEIINNNGQLLFSAKYGISDLITKDGKPFERVYDDKALDVLLSTLQIKNEEYYMLSNSSAIRQVEKEEALGSRHYENTGTYGFVCVNAIMP